MKSTLSIIVRYGFCTHFQATIASEPEQSKVKNGSFDGLKLEFYQTIVSSKPPGPVVLIGFDKSNVFFIFAQKEHFAKNLKFSVHCQTLKRFSQSFPCFAFAPNVVSSSIFQSVFRDLKSKYKPDLLKVNPNAQCSSSSSLEILTDARQIFETGKIWKRKIRERWKNLVFWKKKIPPFTTFNQNVYQD